MIPLHHFMIGLMLFSGGMSVWLASIAWRRHPERWALPFTTLMLAFSWWSFGSATELSVPNLADKLFWLKVQYLVIPPIPFLLLWFCIVYTNRAHWLRWYVVGPMVLIPLINIQMMWFNWGNLWLQEVSLDLTADIPTLFIVHGVWFSIQLTVAYPAILGGLALLGREAWRTVGIRRRQAMIVIAAMLVPTIGNIFITSSEGSIDITPIYFAITGAGISWGLLRYRLFDVGLTARQLLIDSMVDGMIAVNTENRVVDVNTAVTNLLALPKAQIIGRDLRLLLSSYIAISQYDHIRHAGGGELAVEQGGETLSYDVRLSEIGNPPQGMLILLRDVTERKREQEAVQELRETMTRAMVHDLRSPISVAYTTANFLKEVLEGELSPEDNRLLTGMEQNLTRAINLINEILDISRLESGHMALHPRPFALATMVENTFREQQVSAEAKNISLEAQIPAKLPLAEGDYPLLERVFQNLVSNGIKFTPIGGKVRLVVQEHGEQLQVTVQDSGAGVPAQIRPYLFQKFAKGNQEQAGSGLGLAFCKMVLEAHQQRIWLLEATADHNQTGATFCFTLPIATNQTAA